MCLNRTDRLRSTQDRQTQECGLRRWVFFCFSFVFLVYVVLCLIVFGCQYWCNWLPGKTRLRLTCYVSSGTLNPTHSLTHRQTYRPHAFNYVCVTLTSIRDLDLDDLKMYLHTRVEVCRWSIQKLVAKHNRQTDRTKHITMPHLWVIIKDFMLHCCSDTGQFVHCYAHCWGFWVGFRGLDLGCCCPLPNVGLETVPLKNI